MAVRVQVPPLVLLNYEKMFHVYAIRSKVKNYIYVGFTQDLEKRINQHNAGYNKSTKPYRPFELIFTESFSTRTEARSKEKYLKSGVGKEFLKRIS